VYESATLIVDENGMLQLDGIIVTHAKDSKGSGVLVISDGTFIMINGKISNNIVTYEYIASITRWGGYGGGVHNMGNFTMFGGEISNNIANVATGGGGGMGGGVYNLGNFVMSGGVISGNEASNWGGGIRNSGTFTMSGGEISKNTASTGGGVYTTGTFKRIGGTISGNTAKIDCNNVYPTDDDNDVYPDKGNDLASSDNVYSLMNVVAIGVGIIGVVGVVLLFYFRKRRVSRGKITHQIVNRTGC